MLKGILVSRSEFELLFLRYKITENITTVNIHRPKDRYSSHKFCVKLDKGVHIHMHVEECSLGVLLGHCSGTIEVFC